MEDWDQILAQHAQAVWRVAYRVVGTTADADECMQEAFVDAVRVAGRETVRDWGALLRRLVTVRALDCLRRRHTEKARVAGEADCEALPSCEDSPDAQMQRGELADGLRRALTRLPPQQAQVFCLRVVEEMSYEEIAEQLQISVNSIGVILNRARKRLRELLPHLVAGQES